MGMLEILLIVLASVIILALIARLLGQTVGLSSDVILLIIVLMLLFLFFRGGPHFRL